jgi:hypothetical protein
MFFRYDFIERYPKLISPSDCERIINKFEGCPNKAPCFDLEKKDCSQIGLNFDNFDIVSNLIQEPLRKSIFKYYDKYNSYDVITANKITSDYNIQKYDPDQAYHRIHCENGGLEISKNRILAWMIYLNDVTDGGQTYFPQQRRKIKPRVGDLYVWPAYFTHPHKGLISKTQTKYIATGWCHFINI